MLHLCGLYCRRTTDALAEMENGRALENDVQHLSAKVSALKSMSKDIQHEVRSRNELMSQLESAIGKSADAVRSVRSGLRRAHATGGSWHLIALVVYCLLLATVLYILSKFGRIARIFSWLI